ncbi:MAG: hypothetical protein ACI8Z5_000463 [Lentimonas sp.]|jgi:hypothetical protein
MNKASSLILLALILALIIGLGCLRVYMDASTSVRSSESNHDVKITKDMPEDFDPSPTVDAAKELAQSAVMETLAMQMSRETDDLQVVTHPDGRRSVHLGGRFMHMSAIGTGADGSPEIQCFSDYQELATSLQGIPSPKTSLIRHDR